MKGSWSGLEGTFWPVSFCPLYMVPVSFCCSNLLFSHLFMHFPNSAQLYYLIPQQTQSLEFQATLSSVLLFHPPPHPNQLWFTGFIPHGLLVYLRAHIHCNTVCLLWSNPLLNWYTPVLSVKDKAMTEPLSVTWRWQCNSCDKRLPSVQWSGTHLLTYHKRLLCCFLA